MPRRLQVKKGDKHRAQAVFQLFKVADGTHTAFQKRSEAEWQRVHLKTDTTIVSFSQVGLIVAESEEEAPMVQKRNEVTRLPAPEGKRTMRTEGDPTGFEI